MTKIKAIQILLTEKENATNNQCSDMVEIAYDMAIQAIQSAPTDSELTITDKDDQIEVLKNALALAEMENERLTTCSEITKNTDMTEQLGYSHIYKRLAEYEDTGLTPEEIKDLQ